MATINSNHKNPEKPSAEEVAIPIAYSHYEQSAQKGSQSNEFDTKPRNSFCLSPEISKFSPNSPGMSPKYPPPQSPLLRRRSFKGKSRFGEPSINIDSQTIENISASPKFFTQQPSFIHSTPRGISGRTTPKEKEEEVGPDEKEIYQRVTDQLSARNRKRMTIKFILELFVFLVILGFLLSSLMVKSFRDKFFVGVQMWKWFVVIMVIFSGMLVTQWFVHLIVFFIEWKFLLKKNVVYFTHGLQNNVVVFIWIGVVLATWTGLLKYDLKKNHKSRNALEFITWTLVTLLISSFLWLLKTTLIKMLASSFHLNRFFDRIQEAVFHHYVLQTLSGRPAVELCRKISREESCGGQVSFTENDGPLKKKKVVDWTKLHQMRQEKVPSWTMKLLVDVVSNSGLSTMSGILREDIKQGGVKLDDNEITSEEAAIATAVRIFCNVVGDKNEAYIDRDDLHRFMIWEEVDLVYPLFELNEKRQVDLKVFCKFVVRVYQDRQALKHALNDNKTAVDEFNKILIGILIVLAIILWLLLTEIASTKLIVFFSSQLVVAAFIFGNTCKTIFEAIIFVFVMHPFDVGDRCVIDNTMMIVEEMKILTTVFLKFDKEKVYYPNSVLSTKAIGNYYRSPDQGDTLEFSIDYRTPVLKITKLKEQVKQYIDQNPYLWHATHNLVVKEIENMNKIKMVLFFNHTMNFQDFPERSRRRTELILEMKNIFDSLEITYHLLPQEVVLSYMPTNH